METWSSHKVNDFLAGFQFKRPKVFPGFDGARLVNARVSTFVQMGYRRKEARLLHQAVEDLKVFMTPCIKDQREKMETWTKQKVNDFISGFRFTRPKDLFSFDGAFLVNARVSTFIQMGYPRKEAKLLHQAVRDLKVFMTPAMSGPAREYGIFENVVSTRSIKYDIERIQSPPLSKVQMLIARANANPAPPPVMIKKIKKRPGGKQKAIPKPVPQENVVVLSTVKPSVPRSLSDPHERKWTSGQIKSKPVPGEDAVSLSSVKPKKHHNLMPPSDPPSSGGSSRRPSVCSSASSIKDRISAYKGSFQANEEGHRERIRAMKSAKKKGTAGGGKEYR